MYSEVFTDKCRPLAGLVALVSNCAYNRFFFEGFFKIATESISKIHIKFSLLPNYLDLKDNHRWQAYASISCFRQTHAS